MAAQKNRGLGKGLEALFGEVEIEAAAQSETSPQKEGVVYLDINQIKPNTNQPRKSFDEERINELSRSIEIHGVIQPILVRKIKAGRGYEIVAGERRWRAARKAGLKTIPCIIRELTDEQNMLMAIIENMQREDLNPIEEAEGLQRMIKSFGLTQEQVSKSVSKSRPYITNSLRLLKLPEKIQEMTAEGQLSMGHARALLAIESAETQLAAAEKIVKEGLSVRETENLINQGARRKKNPAKRRAEKNTDVLQVERDLKDVLGTRVTLNMSGEKGKIEIEYYSREELERLIETLKSIKNN